VPDHQGGLIIAVWIVNNQIGGAKAVLWAEEMDHTLGTYYPVNRFSGVAWNPV
jgi:hypothetical protein